MNCVGRLDYKYLTTVNMILNLFIVIYYFFKVSNSIPDRLFEKSSKADFLFLKVRAHSRNAFKVTGTGKRKKHSAQRELAQMSDLKQFS